jgi:hypothetical protein
VPLSSVKEGDEFGIETERDEPELTEIDEAIMPV